MTVVFEENMDVYLSRQLVGEYLKEAEDNIPNGLGKPEMAPISTGLGEIYQYVIRPAEGFEDKYSPTETAEYSGLDCQAPICQALRELLRSIQWAVFSNNMK